MADVDSSKLPPLTRELERRPRLGDYRPGFFSRARAPEWEAADSPAMNKTDARFDRRGEMDAGTTVNLRKLQEQLARSPLDEIATLVGGLTYGEMIELSEAIWRAQPDGSATTLENFPSLLHRWSKSRSGAGRDMSEAPRSA
jgi:hypothetical protein